MKPGSKLLLASLTLLLSCRGTPDATVTVGICGPIDPTVGVVVRDSGGIRIVENLTPATGNGPQVSDEPLAVIGARESDPDDVIGRLASALLLSDGRIVVADRLTMQIRVHGPDGALLHRFGREGSGPGEFSSTLAVERQAGDTLIVEHMYGRRYSYLLADGTYLRDAQTDAAQRRILGVLSNGQFLSALRQLARLNPVTEVRRMATELNRLDPTTGSADSIGILEREDIFQFMHGGEFAGFVTSGEVPFGRVESVAVGGDGVFTGTGDRFEIVRLSAAGAVTGRFRVCEEPVAVDAVLLERVIDARVAVGTDVEEARRLRAALAGIPKRTVEPAHLEMHTDAAGRLWVRDFAPAWDPQTWRVFDPDGRWLWSATTPAAVRVLDVGTSRLLGVGRNELGVETVRVHAIRTMEP